MAKDGKYTLGNKMASVKGQQKGAEKSFNPKAPAGISTSSPGKGFKNNPPTSAQAPKVSGAPGAASKNSDQFGKGHKLGNHYSNS